jgi:hypothetical protein
MKSMREKLEKVALNDLKKHGICDDNSVLKVIAHTVITALLESIEVELPEKKLLEDEWHKNGEATQQEIDYYNQAIDEIKETLEKQGVKVKENK